MNRIGPGAADFLDNVENTLKPFFTVNRDDEKKLLEWLNSSVKTAESFYQGYFNTQIDNVLITKGIQWLNQDRYSNRFIDRQGLIARRSPKVVINHVGDFVEQWVSRLTRFRPAVEVNPANPEYTDKEDSKCGQYVVDHTWRGNKMDILLQKYARVLKTCGEAYMWIEWDPTKGDIHPSFIEAQKNNRPIPLKDSIGNQVMTENGDPMFITKAIRIGDIKYSIPPTWSILDEPTSDRADINWCIRKKWMDIDTLKAKYPDKADKIKSGMPETENLDWRTSLQKYKTGTMFYELFHRHSEFMEKGAYIAFTKDVVLVNADLPYSDGKLPYIYMPDIETPDENRGNSFIQQIFPLQFQLNACASLIYKALVLFSHPKIVMPDGSCDINQLINDSTIVSYRGGVPPTLMNNMAAPQEAFQYLNKLEQSLEKLSGIFSMSRGQAPSGVRAAKALRALEEQEDKRGYSVTTKFNEVAIVGNAEMTLSRAGQFFKEDDGRLLRIVGKNNQFLIKKFKTSNLSKPYDVKIEASTALSKSPAGRIQEIIELQNVRFDPEAPFSRSQFYNFLDFQNIDEMKDIASRAAMCAQSENEDLLAENFSRVAPPSIEEDLITHWKIHLQPIQSRDFKEYVKPENKKALIEHIMLTEMLISQKAKGDPFSVPPKIGNPLFAQKLAMECPEFPIYYVEPVPPMAMAPSPMMADPLAMGQQPTLDSPLPMPVGPSEPMSPIPDPLMEGADVGGKEPLNINNT